MKALFNFLAKRGTTGAFIFGAAVIGISLLLIFSGLSAEGYEVSTNLNEVLKADKAQALESGQRNQFFNFFAFPLGIPVLMVGLALITAILFGLGQILSNPKESMKSILGVGFVLILFFVFYSMATPETTGRLGDLHGKFGIEEFPSKIISGGIKTVLTLGIGAVVLMVISEVLNLFK